MTERSEGMDVALERLVGAGRLMTATELQQWLYEYARDNPTPLTELLMTEDQRVHLLIHCEPWMIFVRGPNCPDEEFMGLPIRVVRPNENSSAKPAE